MTRLAITMLLVGIVAAGCRGLAPGASGSASEGRGGTPPTTTTTPSPEVHGPPLESVSPSGAGECALGFGVAEHVYPGLREFARLSDGVAIAEVVSVGDFQYSTETGGRPSCEYIEEAQAVFDVGRMVELRVVTPVAGRGRAGDTLRYLFPGGTLGGDTSPGHHYGLQLPRIGDRMLVLLLDAPFDVDPGEGVLEVNVLELFSIANGRIVTPDSTEKVTVNTVRDVVRGAVPSAPPDR